MEIKNTPKKFIKRTPEDLCRLCGNITKRPIKIFSNVGKSKDLAKKIFYTVTIDLDEHDELSLDICRNCELFVERAYKFQLHSLITVLKIKLKNTTL